MGNVRGETGEERALEGLGLREWCPQTEILDPPLVAAW